MRAVQEKIRYSVDCVWKQINDQVKVSVTVQIWRSLLYDHLSLLAQESINDEG